MKFVYDIDGVIYGVFRTVDIEGKVIGHMVKGQYISVRAAIEKRRKINERLGL